MIVDAISDLHGHYPKLDGGDLLIVAGDLTARDDPTERLQFLVWISEQNYQRKVFIAGNHDTSLMGQNFRKTHPGGADYLCDSGTEFGGLKIWGSPWTLAFKGMNPNCMAFTCKTEAKLGEKFELIPSGTDILVTHSPPWGILDECVKGNRIESVGSRFLRARVMEIAPKLHFFGHIHEYGGVTKHTEMTKFVNASHVDEWYRPLNKVVRVIL